ncbi:hypothetical protein DFH08DRAFT_997105 [Mycena albidolilacea]|uniref:RRM domain-containing protein n=1 Tax=Mycena albidolilacea TaxID=1033008 RepID=A0AAD7A584_9AGAR|nr:hypothetical protein DFH08DRAFT_997105 [Mycena albidolilacea]
MSSILGGITDTTLNHLLNACGPIKLFKHLITPANKPQGSGFAEFEEPDSALRVLVLLNNVELPVLEDGCANKKLLQRIKADEKTHMLDTYASMWSLDPGAAQTSKAAINTLIMHHGHQPRHCRHELAEGKHRLVISEIAQFPEHVTKRKREKMCELQAQIPTLGGVPSGPKMREWGWLKEVELKFGRERRSSSRPGSRNGQGCAGEGGQEPKRQTQTDEELEVEHKEERRHNKEELREQTHILTLECAIARQWQAAESEVHEHVDLRAAQGVGQRPHLQVSVDLEILGFI